MTGDVFEPERDDLPQEGILTALADATDDIIWLFTADWEQVVFVNDAYEEIFGRPVERLRENPEDFVAAVHPDDRQDLYEMMDGVAAGDAQEVEVRVTHDDGTRWLQIQGRPVRNGGEVTHVAGFSRDVTDRKRRERELQETKAKLEQSNEELQHFAYVASHDLQEPLRMVRSYVSLLETEYGDELDGEAEEFIEFAVDGADRMKNLIDGLLQFSRVETHGEEITPCDPEPVLEDARESLGLKIEETDATISVGDLPTVPADERQLQRVFQNLLENAIKYAGESRPVVEIRAEQRDGAVVFAIEDEGVGIPEDDQDRVFDLFERGASVGDEGTGIGLAISNRIVERHGGEMWVDSTEGEGTTVYFSLPEEQ